MNNKLKLTGLAGWLGVIVLILNYALMSFGLLSPNSYKYQGLNLVGAIGIILFSAARHSKQTVMINTFWASIAALALLKMATM